jgi:hypothetical protein
VQINNDSELQNIINSGTGGQYRSKVQKQMVKEFEIVDGFPILDEFEHLEGSEESGLPRKSQAYLVDFRLPLKGISRQLISPSQMNVCNMFSTLYFLQMVVISKSESLKIPGIRELRQDNGF